MASLIQSQAYAMARYKETKQHYLLTTQGHVLLDCNHNRKMADDSMMEIVWSTREPLN
jgi:hypothetical protein